MNALRGEVAFVTGGGAGIGLACAVELARRGARVMITDIDEAAAREVASSIGGAAFALDVRDPVAVDAAVAATVEEFGSLTVAVNNAGVGVPTPFRTAEVTDAEWRRVLTVNLDGVFHCLRAETGVMAGRGGGSIVNIGSIGSLVGLPGAVTYTAAKHAVLGMTKAVAAEYAADGVRVNLVTPGYVDTAISPRSPEQKAALAAKHPLGRLATSEEVAAVVCFLASRESSFVTGSYYSVDGGFTAL
ncbi:SDR family NAD(P)-dependent oxidoreductase [Saccharomonospora sp. NPDC046836]|uniref:SDR family NAD(P)-dependent oxidoreductase n=1 Tax=Saccharomonospora sp. NPDC046836 TaxID=3156921 RepID=UPI0033EA85B4